MRACVYLCTPARASACMPLLGSAPLSYVCVYAWDVPPCWPALDARKPLEFSARMKLADSIDVKWYTSMTDLGWPSFSSSTVSSLELNQMIIQWSSNRHVAVPASENSSRVARPNSSGQFHHRPCALRSLHSSSCARRVFFCSVRVYSNTNKNDLNLCPLH